MIAIDSRVRPAPGWILVRPLTTDRTPGEPIPCRAVYSVADIAEGTQVLVRNRADAQKVEAARSQTNSHDQRKFEDLLFVPLADVCAIEAAQE